IRDKLVTGVQTCALPIYIVSAQDETAERERHQRHQQAVAPRGARDLLQPRRADVELAERLGQTAQVVHPDEDGGLRKYVVERERSEERRVGKEWSGWVGR